MAPNKHIIIFLTTVIGLACCAWVFNSRYNDIDLTFTHYIFGGAVVAGIAYLIYLLRKK